MLWASLGCYFEGVQGCRCVFAVAVIGRHVVVEVLVLVSLPLLLLVDRTDPLALEVGLEEARMEDLVFVKLVLGSRELPVYACVTPMSDVKMRTCGHLIVTST